MKELQHEELKQTLFSRLAEKGAKLIGVADLSGIVSGEMQTGSSCPCSQKHCQRFADRADERILRCVLCLKRNAGRYCYVWG